MYNIGVRGGAGGGGAGVEPLDFFSNSHLGGGGIT